VRCDSILLTTLPRRCRAELRHCPTPRAARPPQGLLRSLAVVLGLVRDGLLADGDAPARATEIGDDWIHHAFISSEGTHTTTHETSAWTHSYSKYGITERTHDSVGQEHGSASGEVKRAVTPPPAVRLHAPASYPSACPCRPPTTQQPEQRLQGAQGQRPGCVLRGPLVCRSAPYTFSAI